MKRLVLAAITTCLAAILAVQVIVPVLRKRQAEPAPLVILTSTAEDPGFAAWRAGQEAKFPPIPIKAYPETTLVRAIYGPSIAKALFPQIQTPDMQYKAQQGFRRPPGGSGRVTWDEHPDGFWRAQTNSTGQRMDADLQPGGPYFAILGDSHLEGACNNDESVAGLVKAALAETNDPQQVVNMACGGFSFHEYLGSLEFLNGDVPGQLVDLTSPSPTQTMAVFIYGGNDFLEVLKQAHFWSRTDRPKGWGIGNERLLGWQKERPMVVGQALSSLVYFRNVPQEIETSLAESLAVCEELKRHSAKRGIRLVFLYLPSALESEGPRHHALLSEPIASLRVSREDLLAPGKMADRMLASLEATGCETIDLRPTLKGSTQYYWNKDLHLNLAGQQVVAQRLLEWYNDTQ